MITNRFSGTLLMPIRSVILKRFIDIWKIYVKFIRSACQIFYRMITYNLNMTYTLHLIYDYWSSD